MCVCRVAGVGDFAAAVCGRVSRYACPTHRARSSTTLIDVQTHDLSSEQALCRGRRGCETLSEQIIPPSISPPQKWERAAWPRQRR